MRVLVTAEMSGASRSTLETVITETPARNAISLRRTILYRRTAPVQFLAQRFEKATAGNPHQPDSFCAVPDFNVVSRHERNLHLAISGQENLQRFSENLHPHHGIAA